MAWEEQVSHGSPRISHTQVPHQHMRDVYAFNPAPSPYVVHSEWRELIDVGRYRRLHEDASRPTPWNFTTPSPMTGQRSLSLLNWCVANADQPSFFNNFLSPEGSYAPKSW